MTNTSTSRGLKATHIKRLGEKLSEWKNPADSNDNEGEFIDLWFADGDVLSVYINSAPGDYKNSWPSLYALGRREDAPRHENEIDSTTKELTDSIAIAISYFLFGRFLDTLKIQGRRFLLTPEHSRELDGMAIAVSFAWRHEGANWMSQLIAQYMALANNVDDLTGSEKNIDAVFQLLRAGSPSSKVSRVSDLRRHLRTMQDTAFFPSEEPGTAFAFDARGAQFVARVKQLAIEAFDIFIDTLVEAHPDIEQYTPIKRATFEFHAPDRRLSEYVDELLLQARERSTTVDGQSENPLIRFTHSTLTEQAKIAAREVSDVYAFARIVTLAEFLNNKHPQDPRHWRINLLTGSNKLRTLHAKWKKKATTVNSVRLVHPLSVMGVDGFAQPDEHSKEQGFPNDSPGAFALRALSEGTSNDIDVNKFVHDFKGLLTAAAVSAAPRRERWLRSLRHKIDSLGHDKFQYLKCIRDAISRDFVATFAQLNTIPVSRRGQLPSVSLPALALPMEAEDPSLAQKFVMGLHSNSAAVSRTLRSSRTKEEQSKNFIPVIADLIKADPTGYSALLCSGLGYLTQGRAWLPITEAVANTAVAFALTQESEELEKKLYPQGNEALYFAGFVSRMQVEGLASKHEQARDWFKHHNNFLHLAINILDEFASSDEIGNRLIHKEKKKSRTSVCVTLAQLVHLRYEVEIFAAKTFAHLIDRFNPTESKLLGISPLKLLESAKDLANRWKKMSDVEVEPHYAADVSFIGTQLVASSIQSWLCALADNATTDELKDSETWMPELASSQIILTAAPGSNLICVLTAIFNSRTTHNKIITKKTKKVEQHLDEMQFAALDEQRCPLFSRLLNDKKSRVSELFKLS